MTIIAALDVHSRTSDRVRYPHLVTRMSMAERRKVVEWLGENPPDYIWNDDFKTRNAAKEILIKPDDLPSNTRKSQVSGGQDLSRYFGQAARLRLLTAEEEVFYFRRMNYFRWRAATQFEALNTSRPSLRALRQIVAELKQGDDDRNVITEYNLRLVIPLAHRLYLRSESVWDYISEGNAALLRAIRGFDYGRGFRFSTYATWAIVNSLQWLAGKQHRDGLRFVPADGVFLDAVESEIESATAENMRVTIAREQINSLLDVLDQRSRSIIAMRFGIGSDAGPKTLKEVGEYFGVSKERVRQIEMNALTSMMNAGRQSVALGA